MNEPIFKILGRQEWQQAKADGIFRGSPVDTEDGYIHFSTSLQVAETAARHFQGREDLLVLSVDSACCDAAALRFEPSRGGALFPHLYGPLPLRCVLRVDPLPLECGVHRFPAHLDLPPASGAPA